MLPITLLPVAVATVRVRLAFSYLAVVPWAEGDFRRRLPFADACRPFERYALPFVDYATFDSLHWAHEQDLRVRPFCRLCILAWFTPVVRMLPLFPVFSLFPVAPALPAPAP